MSNKSVAIILLNYKDYAEKYLAECIDSLRKQDYQGKMKIFIVDNASSPESAAFLYKNVPEAELILNKNNDGFAKGNNDAMKLALAQGFEYIVLFNLDTVVEINCVSEMVKVFEITNNQETITKQIQNSKFKIQNSPIGAVQARLMLWPEKDKINSLGNATHFLGFGFGTGYNEIFQDSLSSGAIAQGEKFKIQNLRSIFYPSGAAVMFKASVLKEIGLFDEEYWMYNEDQDIGWRIWLAGYCCVLADKAVVYHKYEFNRSIRQFYWLDRNRIISIIRNYRLPTLVLIFPAFVIMEIGLILFSLKSGWFKEKMRVWQYFLTPNKWFYLIKARQEVRKIRKVKDRDIIELFSGKIAHQGVDDVKLKLINPFFNLYWWSVKKIVWW
jgi:GT2 family glycosyltransferase